MRRIGKILWYLGAALLLASAAGWAALQSPAVRRALVDYAAQSLSGEEMQVEITGFSGDLPFDLRAREVRLRDARGVWLTLRDATLEWEADFFPFRWRIESLGASRLHLARLPEGGESQTGFSLPELPPLTIESIHLPRVAIEEAVTGSRQVIAVEGSLAGQEAHLTLHTLEGPDTALALTLNRREALRLDASLEEAPGGIVAALLGLPPERALAAALEGNVAGDILTIQSAEVKSGPLRLSAQGRVDLSEETLALALEGRTESPDWLIPYASGPWQASAALEGKWETPSFTLAAQGGVRPDSASLGRLVGETLRIEAKGSLNGDVLAVESFMLQGARASAQGEGTYDIARDVLALEADIAIPDAGDIDPNLRGALTARLSAQGRPEALEGSLALTLREDEHGLELASPFRLRENVVTFEPISGGASGVRVSGRLSHALQDGRTQASLRLDAPDLSGLRPYVAETIGGRGDAAVELTLEGGRAEVDGRATFSGLTYGDVKAAQAQAVLHMQGAEAASPLSARISLKRAEIAGISADAVQMEAQGTRARTQWTLRAEATAPTPYRIRAQGALKIDKANWTLSLAELRGEADGKDIALRQPAVLAQEDGALRLSGLEAAIDGGAVTAEGIMKPSGLSASASLSNLPLAWFTDAPASARLEGEVRLEGTPARPAATFSAQLHGWVSRPDAEAYRIVSQGEYRAGTLSLRAHLEDRAQGRDALLEAALRVPATFSLEPFALDLPPQSPLSGTLTADARLGPLSRLFLPPGQDLRGLLRGALNIAGTFQTPRIEGELTLSQGHYENLSAGVTLEDIRARLIPSGDALQLADGRARAGEGSVSFSGTASLEAPYALDIELAFNEAGLLHSREASGTVNGALQVSGPADSPLVAGELTLGPMEIRLPPSQEDIPRVDVVNEEALPDQPWRSRASAATDVPVRLDVRLEAPGRVFVRGRGLETEMRGAIVVQGTLGQPEIEGRLRTVRGTYTLLDRELTLSEGTLTFRGAMPPSPYLHVVAATQVEGIAAGITLNGPIRSPSLALTSTPALPQDEIMARLLFGRDLQSVTPFQAVQLAQALRSLRGEGEGLDLLGKARDLLGVDRLSVGETEEGGYGVGAGKYISDKVYIGVEGGTAEEAGKVKAEIEVSPQFSVETETGGRASGARFNWKYDY